jgi:hypothetical protein
MRTALLAALVFVVPTATVGAQVDANFDALVRRVSSYARDSFDRLPAIVCDETVRWTTFEDGETVEHAAESELTFIRRQAPMGHTIEERRTVQTLDGLAVAPNVLSPGRTQMLGFHTKLSESLSNLTDKRPGPGINALTAMEFETTQEVAQGSSSRGRGTIWVDPNGLEVRRMELDWRSRNGSGQITTLEFDNVTINDWPMVVVRTATLTTPPDARPLPGLPAYEARYANCRSSGIYQQEILGTIH